MDLGKTILPTSSTCTVVFIGHNLPIGIGLANHSFGNHSTKAERLSRAKAEILTSPGQKLKC
jgi:hypothetical protein